MTRYQGNPMKRLTNLALALAVAGTLGGCELDVANPNSPDARRAFVDPAGLQQLLGGAFRTWVETRGDYFHGLPMTAMADNYTASWNNAAIRRYSSVGSDCPARCGWTNSATAPEAGGGPTVAAAWYGYYTVFSGATDVLSAIKGGLCFDANCATDNTVTSRNKAIAKMLQGMAFSGIATLYDQGFAVDENSDLSDALAIPFSSRADMRAFALTKFEEAYTEAGLKTWSTPAEWMGVGAGTVYSNTQIRKIIRSMQAELIAMWPRNGSENTAAAWGTVASLAAQGVSAAPAFDWQFYIDITGAECGLDCVKTWGNSLGTMRVDTRVAALVTTNHQNPWPDPLGNPCPLVARNGDRRVGDGSWGPANNFNGYATQVQTAGAGTDYACSGVVVFPAARGQYHQSNLTHIRYVKLAYIGENLPGDNGTGQDPFFTRQMNDLLWAEGLIRSGGSQATAAALINNSRVGRGGLVPLTGSEGTAALLTALQYEQEIEFMGQGVMPFYNRRRIDGLSTGTPRHMPVPAKEMDVLVREIYTFGGPGAPDMAPGTQSGGADRVAAVRSVRQVHEDFRKDARRATSSNRNW